MCYTVDNEKTKTKAHLLMEKTDINKINTHMDVNSTILLSARNEKYMVVSPRSRFLTVDFRFLPGCLESKKEN